MPVTANGVAAICLEILFQYASKWKSINFKYIPLQTVVLAPLSLVLTVVSVTDWDQLDELLQVLPKYDVSLQVRGFRVPDMVVQAEHTWRDKYQ